MSIQQLLNNGDSRRDPHALSNPLLILRNPSSPTPLEKGHAQREIALTSSEISSIQGDILFLQARINHLQTEEQLFQQYLAAQKSLLAPIRQLPDDILAEIFLLCASPLRITTRADFAWKLGRVCVRWRDVSISLAGLWANINFDHHTLRNDKALIKQAYEMAKQCLERSQGHLLTVRILFSDNMNQEIVDLFTPSSERWESVEIAGTHAKKLKCLSNAVHGHVQQLRQLDIYTLQCEEDFYAFEDAANLVCVSMNLLEGYRDYPDTPGWPIARLKLPWAQLMRLSFDTILSLSEYTEILLYTKALISLDLRGASIVAREILLDASPIYLPVLQKLYFNGHTSRPALRSLYLPSLSELHFCLGHSDYEWPEYALDEMVALIQRSGCRMQKLTLCGAPGIEYAERLMQMTPNVSVLHLSSTHDPTRDDILRKLTVGGNREHASTILLPSLHTLLLDSVYIDELEPLLNLVISRTRNITIIAPKCDNTDSVEQLKNLKFYLRSNEWSEGTRFLEELQSIRDDGYLALDLEWYHPTVR